MKMLLKACTHRSLLALAATALLGACAGDTMAPPVADARSQEAVSPFTPSEASKALIGVSDGTYTFQVDPTQAQSLYLGANLLYLPANAICDISSSTYGAPFWNDGCTPEREPLTITAVVRNAATKTPSIDFYPAMRFNPATVVNLYMFVGHGIHRQNNSLLIKYCDDNRVCIDESIADPSLATKTDRSKSIVYRRIKHFSGFIVVALLDEALESF